MDIEKMKQALAKAGEIDALLFDAGVYDDEAGLASAFSLKSFMEDLDIDIARIESGDLP